MLQIFLMPVFSQAAIVVPTANLTIVVNTQDQEGSFHLDLRNKNGPFWNDYSSFDLQTENFTVSDSVTLDLFSNQYLLSEQISQGWSAPQIDCISDNAGNSFGYDRLNASVVISAVDGSNITCIFDHFLVNKKQPVLVVPGILGTEIFKDQEKLWPDILRMLRDIGDDFMDSMQFNFDLTPSDVLVSEKLVIRKESIFDYSASLITEFQNQGYIENEDLFTFPYDWRYGVTGVNGQGLTNVDLLKEKIEEILSQTGASKIDIIAHSTGGLIVKKYVIDNADHGLNKVIFVGVPNLGAPKAVKVLAQGDNFGVIGLSDDEMKKIARNLPVTYDLAPSQSYFDRSGSFLRIVDRDASGVRTSDLDYRQAWDLLASQGDSNAAGLANGQALHTDSFEDFDLRTAGVDFYNIVGCKTGSIGKVVEYRFFDPSGKAQISFAPVKEIKGDKTVPFESADSSKADDSKKYYVIKASHGEMLSANGSRQLLVNIISGSELDIGSGIITKQNLDSDPRQCELKGKWWQIFSPVDIEALDQNGKRAGLAEDGSLENQIPGADFAVFGQEKFMYLPDDGVYQINLQGTGNGTFTLKGQTIDNGQIVGSENFIDIPVSTSSSGTINTDGGETVLYFDNQVILPTTILDENDSQDLAGPVSTAELSGHKGVDNFFRSNVEVFFAASDDSAGVLKSLYRLDNGAWQECPPPPLPSPQGGGNCSVIIDAEGVHELDFYSVDRAGNKEPMQSVEFVIDKTPPEAFIQFDAASKDVRFTGTDNLSSSDKILISDADDRITLCDQAGNETILRLKEKDRKRKQRIEIRELLYNGKPADIKKTILQFSWQFDKKSGHLKQLEQRARSRKDFNIEAVYKNNRTKITGRDHSGKIKLDLPGLVLLKIQTKAGDIEWSYQ